MSNNPTRREFSATALAAIAASTMPAPYLWAAEKKYDFGASGFAAHAINSVRRYFRP
jgi:hypothetical protein